MLPDSSDRAWKPNLLVPVEDPGEVRGTFRFITSLTYPRGSAKLLGLTTDGEGVQAAQAVADTRQELPEVRCVRILVRRLGGRLRRRRLRIDAVALLRLLPPQPLVRRPPGQARSGGGLSPSLSPAGAYGLGVILFADHPKAGLGLEGTINLWVRPSSTGWEEGIKQTNLDLALLVAYVLRKNWKAELNLITLVRDETAVESQRTRLVELMQLSRIRGNVLVAVRDFPRAVEEFPADLNPVRDAARPRLRRLSVPDGCWAWVRGLRERIGQGERPRLTHTQPCLPGGSSVRLCPTARR